MNEATIKYESFEYTAQNLKLKEQKIMLLQKSKKKCDMLLSRCHNLIAAAEAQKLVGDQVRNLNEVHRLEHERLKYEGALDDLERELKDLIRGKPSADSNESSVLRAQYLRREINELEERIRDCDTTLDQLSKKEKQLDRDIQYQEEKVKSQQAIGTNEGTKTITYLTKESEELRREIEKKDEQIFGLTRELNFMK